MNARPSFFSLSYTWQRITIPEILEDEWFKIDHKPPVFYDDDDTSLDDVDAVFQDSEASLSIFEGPVRVLVVFLKSMFLIGRSTM